MACATRSGIVAVRGHVQTIAHQCHAKGCVQPGEKLGAYVSHAAAMGVAQQGDAVGAGHSGASTPHEQAHEPAFDALAITGLGRRIGFGHQHVAVGQHVEPTRMVQIACERVHLSTLCRLRLRTRGPAHGRPTGWVAISPQEGVARISISSAVAPVPRDTDTCMGTPLTLQRRKNTA